MLICPQCQFENPNTNKFCQGCGTSLIEKVCHQCGTKVNYSAENCPHCGAVTGTFWLALVEQVNLNELIEVEKPSIVLQPPEELTAEVPSSSEESAVAVAKKPSLDLEQEILKALMLETETSDGEEKAEAEDLDDEKNVITELIVQEKEGLNSEAEKKKIVAINSFKFAEEYLDTQQQYRLNQGVEEEIKILRQTENYLLLKTRVGDTNPLQKSRLSSILTQEATLWAEIKETCEDFQGIKEVMVKQMKIPELAVPYLIFQENTPIMPVIHDAWSENNREIVLLSDRSEWQLLSDLLKNEPLASSQIVRYIYEMAKLWQNLSQVSCCQTLLTENNFKIDETLSLCLEQLIPDEPDNPHTLQDLGRMWQNLFMDCKSETQNLSTLFILLENDEIQNIEELCELLRQILEDEEQESKTSETEQYIKVPDSMVFDDVDDEEEMLYSDEADDMPTIVVPMQVLSITEASCTDIGRQRFHNEDFYGIETKSNKQENPQGKKFFVRGLYIVCDGMGGHAAGEVASAMAVQTLARYFQNHWQSEKLPDEATILEGILHANDTIYQVNLENARSGSGRMGTTLVMALVQDTQVAIAHVGDSRAYAISRKSGLEQLTVDHEVGQMEIQRGVESEIAYARPDAYQLTQALGPRSNDYIKPDIKFFELKEDTIFLLCSDGLSDNDIIENNWEIYLEPLISSKANLQQGLEQLIDFANEQNGHDNITGLMIRVKLQPDVSQKPLF
ncbi:MAG: serine/threonine phosphatase [Gomphosphaeria aponina SAG 52.96 = DSM 107014]|uniref:Serine/threonine phosphatase n=1 Tax=Gomphosphaeria aponina SAG 52.96 = DSM 107014 TaxID=1521640 RepID=A0A941GTE8_9CHRO|nr:serine/threonine phosphatase [Gomphosphaeria aponina SAG 52.96 = DSM 107014]